MEEGFAVNLWQSKRKRLVYFGNVLRNSFLICLCDIIYDADNLKRELTHTGTHAHRIRRLTLDERSPTPAHPAAAVELAGRPQPLPALDTEHDFNPLHPPTPPTLAQASPTPTSRRSSPISDRHLYSLKPSHQPALPSPAALPAPVPTSRHSLFKRRSPAVP
ncbi:hypothetical protein KFK09_018591 [Dendrobium nobile]|uniref:Uncharacterized protein n=1 Tax=Dendrobium nobile TaxID=94219 RepID=A0A8T3AVN1_DENNO|nr:hypothetical protein KFK09_018591 [Dendrobium nobile]